MLNNKNRIILLLCFYCFLLSDAKAAIPPLFDRGGFSVRVMPVCMLSFGGGKDAGFNFRLGASLSLMQQIGDWNINAGADAYFAYKQKFGLGTTFGGLGYDDGRHGGSFIVNHYFCGDQQTSGMARMHLGDFRIAFEDDIFGVLGGAKVGLDRYRTAAIELQYKAFILGANVYTNDPRGALSDIMQAKDANGNILNNRGGWLDGRQWSSPLYIGIIKGDQIIRAGLSTPLGGYLGQNMWHRNFPGMATPDFKPVSRNTPFVQIGMNTPYSLY